LRNPSGGRSGAPGGGGEPSPPSAGKAWSEGSAGTSEDRKRMGRPATLVSLLVSLLLAGLGEVQLARQSITLGLALYAVAIPLFCAAIVRGTDHLRDESHCPPIRLRIPKHRLLPGPRRLLGTLLCAVAVLTSLRALLLFTVTAGQSTRPWLAYGASLLLFVLGVLAATPGSEAKEATPASELAALGGILLLAILLRSARLDAIPPGIWYDEARIGLEARSVLQSPEALPIYSASMNQIAHHLFLFAAALRLFGDTISGLRMASGLFGVAGVLAAYLCGREYRGGRFGLLLAFIVATMRWHINFSRIAMNGVDAPFFEFLALYFALRLLRRPSATLRSALGLGLSLGLGLCFYSPTRLFVAALCLFLAGWWLARRLRRPNQECSLSSVAIASRPRDVLLGLGVVLVALSLAAMPTLHFALTQPDVFWARARQVSVFTHAGDADPVQLLAANTEQHLLMFNTRGDSNGRHNLPGAPTVDHVSGVLLLLGAGLAVARKDALGGFFLLLLPIGLLGGILSLHFESPQSLRSIGALPAVAFFVALSLDALWRQLRCAPADRPSAWTAIPGSLALVLIAGLNGYTYFFQQVVDPQVRDEFMVDQTLVARRMVELGNEPVYYLDPQYAGSRPIAFEAPGVASRQETIDPLDPLPVREPAERAVAYFVSAERRWILDALARLYPEVQLESLPGDDTYATTAYLALLRPEDLASLQGLDLEYLPGADWPPAGSPSLVTRVSTVEAVWPADAPIAAPFSAIWTGVLYAPEYGWYEVQAEAPGTLALTVDGETREGDALVTESLLLAQGNHYLSLAALSGTGDVRLSWRGHASSLCPVPQWALYASPVTANGLLGKYYANGSWEGSPTIERVDALLDIYFHLTPLTRPYSVEWTGFLVVPQSGRYELGLSSKDQSALHVDGRLLAAADGPATYAGGWTDLTAGLHALTVAFQDLSGYSRIHLYWTPPWGDREVIRSEYLWPGDWGTAASD
jgi:hypothetical protein